MKRTYIFILVGSLFLTLIAWSVLFVRDRKPSMVNQDQIRISEKQSGGTSLVKAPKEIPEIGYDAWKESHPNRVQFASFYSKDADGAYYYHMRIINADPDSFDVYNDQYAHDNKTVYYQGYTVDRTDNDIFIIRGADPTSFQALGDGYAKDANHAYFRGEEMMGADPETFESLWPIDVLYAKDKNFVYRENKKLLGFDAPSFRIAEKLDRSPVYLIDKNRVVIGQAEKPRGEDVNEVKDREIVGVDPSTFVALGGLWGKDKTRAYYGTEAIEGSDPKTFQVLGTNNHDFGQMTYAKDENNVYSLSKRVFGADSKSFQVVENVWMIQGSFGEDKTSAFKDGEIFPKNDLAYFRKSKIPPSAKNLGSNYYLYRDNIYHYSPPIQEGAYFGLIYAQYSPEQILADPATFQVLKNGYARDKEYVYYGDSKFANDPDDSFMLLKPPYSKTNKAVFLNNDVISGALPDSFEILSLGYAKDEQSIFYRDRKVNGADTVTFKVLGRGLSSDDRDYGSSPYYYAKDKDHIFCVGGVLEDADLKTFVLKGKNGMPQDKFHHYDGCEMKE